MLALTSVLVRNEWQILVGVTGKGLIPNGESLLPKVALGFRLVVCEFRMIPLSRQRWSDDCPQPQLGGWVLSGLQWC